MTALMKDRLKDKPENRFQNKLRRILKLYLSSAFLYGMGIILFNSVPYYLKTLSQATQTTLTYLYLLYLLIAPFYYLIFAREDSENKPYLFLRYLYHLFRKGKLKPERKEKVALLFLLVKLFYLPLMIDFFFNNLGHLLYPQPGLYWYPLLFTLIFTLDTLVFSLGYAFESRKLKNVVKSVEPTLFGWAVALACYPPFNGWLGNYIPWGANDYIEFWNPTSTFIFRIAIIFFLVIYVWATLALGPKASNLTNRGIVWKFPYSVIRHPAYLSKTLTWWLTLLPVINWQFALGMLFWSVIYYFRSTTEEKHLLQDPDYQAYCRKVRYRFIPHIY